MFKFDKQKDEFQLFQSTFKYKLSVLGKNPHFDWKMLIALSFVLFVVASLIAYLNFSSVQSELNQDFISNIPTKRYNMEEFEKVSRKFEEKKFKYENFGTASSTSQGVDQND